MLLHLLLDEHQRTVMCEYSGRREVSFHLNYRFLCEQMHNVNDIPGWECLWEKKSGLVGVLIQRRFLLVSYWAKKKINKSIMQREFCSCKKKKLKKNPGLLHSSWYLLNFWESRWTSLTHWRGRFVSTMTFAGKWNTQWVECAGQCWKDAWQIHSLCSFGMTFIRLENSQARLKLLCSLCSEVYSSNLSSGASRKLHRTSTLRSFFTSLRAPCDLKMTGTVRQLSQFQVHFRVFICLCARH